MEGRRLFCLFLVILFSAAAATHLVHGDDATVLDIGLVSATKAYQESRRPPEVKLGGRKLGVTEQFPASRSTMTVAANELLYGGEGRRSINCERRLRRRFSHEQEWNNNDFVAFNADYKAPRHHPPKNN